jgi:hypothetical protein
MKHNMFLLADILIEGLDLIQEAGCPDLDIYQVIINGFLRVAE